MAAPPPKRICLGGPVSPVIWTTVLPYLATHDICRMAQTCRSVRASVKQPGSWTLTLTTRAPQKPWTCGAHRVTGTRWHAMRRISRFAPHARALCVLQREISDDDEEEDDDDDKWLRATRYAFPHPKMRISTVRHLDVSTAYGEDTWSEELMAHMIQACSPQLETLCVTNRVASFREDAALRVPTSLQRFQGRNLELLTARGLAHLWALPQLRVLDVRVRHIIRAPTFTKDMTTTLSRPPGSSRLSSLYMDVLGPIRRQIEPRLPYAQLRELSVRVPAGGLPMDALRHLRVLRATSAHHLMPLRLNHWTQLQALELNGEQQAPFRLNDLADLPRCPRLHTLVLSKPGMSAWYHHDLPARDLVRLLARIPQLRRLYGRLPLTREQLQPLRHQLSHVALCKHFTINGRWTRKIHGVAWGPRRPCLHPWCEHAPLCRGPTRHIAEIAEPGDHLIVPPGIFSCS